jgi:hypothetical protein
VFNIDENSLQLNNGKCRMGIVELDGNLLGELLPGAVGLLEAANNIVKGGSNPEVLLLQTKLFSALQVVVGVQHSTDGLSPLLIRDRTFVIAIVEFLEIKLSARCFTGPESQVVGCRRIITGDWDIIGDSLNNLTTLPDGNGLSILIRRLSSMSKELNLRPG